MSAKRDILQPLLTWYGVTFAEELSIKLDRQTPSALFKLLCASLLFSARIGHQLASRAAAALFRNGWTNPKKMAAATWEERARTLNQSGYARYDERTSTMLEQTSRLLLDKYHGDLKKLREQAGRDPAVERELLKQFKGIGDVGVDIFFREAHGVWDELYPFVDPRALQAAKKLGLGKDADGLAKLVQQKQFPNLVAALIRVALDKKAAGVLSKAA
jgi:endonuclease III